MIKVQQKDFNYALEVSALSKGNHNIGGVCAFTGLVRDMLGDKQINYLNLEHYPGMTEKCLSDLETEAHQRWPLERSLIIHRYGQLNPGDQIVLVAVSSVHRDAAFDACRFLIDCLKTQAPFWKLECMKEDSQWVAAKDIDNRAYSYWLKDNKKEL